MMRERTYVWSGVGFAAFLGVILVARSSQPQTPHLDTSFVAERWATALRQYNITPVFPPHYMQVGDIYLILARPGEKTDANTFRRYGLWLGRADVRPQPPEEATDESVPSSTPSSGATRDSSPRWPLRPTAFPGFNLVQVSDSDVHAGLLTRLFGGAFGASGRGDLIMSVSIPLAEDQELPAIDAELAYKRFCEFKDGQSPCSIDDSRFAAFLGTLRQTGDPPNLVPIIVILTHVFYARQISYFFSTRSEAAFALDTGVFPRAAATTGPAATTSKESGDHLRAADIPATNWPPSSTDAVRSPASASISSLTSTGGGITLNQTFDTPVAIGFRGLEFLPVGYSQPPKKVTSGGP